MIVSEKETDSDILDRIKAKGREIISSLTKIGSNKSLNQEPNDNKVFYTKGDSQKLENFLRQEREGTAKIIKKDVLNTPRNVRHVRF